MRQLGADADRATAAEGAKLIVPRDDDKDEQGPASPAESGAANEPRDASLAAQLEQSLEMQERRPLRPRPELRTGSPGQRPGQVALARGKIVCG